MAKKKKNPLAGLVKVTKVAATATKKAAATKKVATTKKVSSSSNKKKQAAAAVVKAATKTASKQQNKPQASSWDKLVAKNNAAAQAQAQKRTEASKQRAEKRRQASQNAYNAYKQSQKTLANKQAEVKKQQAEKKKSRQESIKQAYVKASQTQKKQQSKKNSTVSTYGQLGEKSKTLAKANQDLWKSTHGKTGKEAQKIGKNIDAQGKTSKTETVKVNWGTKKPMTNVGVTVATYAEQKKQIDDELNKPKYSSLSDEQKDRIAKETIKANSKETRKSIDDYVNSEMKDTVKYKNLTSDEYLRVQNAERMSGGSKAKNAALGKDLAKKVGKLNTAQYADESKRRGIGAIQGVNPLPVELDKMGSGAYSKGDKNIIEKGKESKEYKQGYTVGAMASFLTSGGVGGVEEAIGKGLIKAAGKKGVETASKKGLVKATTKAGTKTIGKKLTKDSLGTAEKALIGKSAQLAKKTAEKNATKASTKFIANRGADAIVSSPLNLSQSIREATDKDGNVNWSQAGLNMLANTAMDAAVGGGLELAGKGISKVVTKKNYNKIIKLMARQKAGIPLSKSESDFLNKAITEARQNVISRAQREAVEKVKAERTASDKAFSQQVDDVITGKSKTGQKLTIGKTPEKLQSYGAKDVDMKINQNTVRKIAYPAGYEDALRGIKKLGKEKSQGHNLGVGTVKDLRKDLENPTAILKSDTQDNSFVVFTKKVDTNGNPIMVAVHLDKKGNVEVENEIASEYGKDNFSGFIKEQREKGNILYENKKNGLEELPRNGLQLPEVSDTSDPINKIYQDSQKVNTKYEKGIKKETAQTVNTSQTPPHLTSETESGYVSTNKISEKSNSAKENHLNIDPKAPESVSSKATKYDSKADEIKAQSDKEVIERADKGVTNDEISQHYTNIRKTVSDMTDDNGNVNNGFDDAQSSGLFNKRNLMSQKEAMEKAKKMYEEDPEYVYKSIMDIEATPTGVKADIHEVEAKLTVALNDMMDKINKGVGDEAENIKRIMDISEKATEIASSAGQAMNAAKMILRSTPEGRVRTAKGEVKRLNAKFKDRLKEPLELSEEQASRIIKATSNEEIDKVFKDINVELWDKIPSTAFEKFNEIRHCSMLLNPKTHLRNFGGNVMFAVARAGSDSIERALTKAAKGKIEKMGGSAEMATKVTHKEISDNKPELNALFHEVYEKSDSKSRFIETTRPDGSKIVKARAINAAIQLDYRALEKEDVIPTFRPEFRKQFVRYCKTHNLDFANIENIKKADLDKATSWAMNKAEIATFRDSCALSDFLVGLKTTTAGKKGKTKLGTSMYRVGNMVLESQLPFVKTPINVFRRSIDYSPISILRATSELLTAKDAETLINGIHHMSTGLTGTGVMALGMWLANNDLITLEAGDVSGDAYYDRDMGYQDYSLKIGGYSFTIDWAAPMQSSLFMGAQMYELSQDKFSLDNILKGFGAITNPMIDMSFMSSSKDTLDNFMEDVYNQSDGKTNWSGALLNLLGGSIPQNFLGGFAPQLMSQAAQAFDTKQRDTRSTADGDLAKSWQSWSRKMINKVPGLRNYILNPKLDRFGNDKETGGNIVTRLLNSFINPANTKQIQYTKTDKELIKIYNHMEECYDKTHFFYNFTGNPTYDLSNGKRMTYDEAYKYGKTNRKEQTKLIETMMGAKSYSNMTWEMKAEEVNDSHWISTTIADQKTYGNKYAAQNIIANGSDNDKEAYQANKSAGGTNKDFVDFYVQKEKIVSRTHDTGYYTKALAAALFAKTHPNTKTNMAYAYDIYKNKLDTANEYLDKGGTYKEYSNAMCNVMSGINIAGVSSSQNNKAVSAANYSINKRTYKAMGLSSAQANMGYGLTKKYNYDLGSLSVMKADMKMQFDADKNGSLKKSEIITYIESLGIKDNTEKACLYQYFGSSNSKNPYGTIPDWLSAGKTNSSSSGRSYSKRRSYGHSGHSGGSSSSGGNKGMTWEQWLKELGLDSTSSSSTTKTSVSNNTADSALTEAYRKRQLKLLQATSGKRKTS